VPRESRCTLDVVGVPVGRPHPRSITLVPRLSLPLIESGRPRLQWSDAGL